MARRGHAHRWLRWLWTSRRPDARLARAALLPAAGLWRLAARVRTRPQAAGSPSLPTVFIGNLTVGDSGRMPLLVWMGRYFAARGARPGFALRRAGGVRAAALAHAVAGSLTAEGPMAASELQAEGAHAVLWDGPLAAPSAAGYRLAVVAAETAHAVRWPVPAGPWRESWRALRSVDVVVVTRRRAPAEAAQGLADELARASGRPVACARLGVQHLEGLVSGAERPVSLLEGRRVVAASGSADPDSFVAQIKATGAAVQVATWGGGGSSDVLDEDMAWLAHAVRRADYVVVSEQDAIRLRDRWPASVAEPLVAVLDLTWETGGDLIARGLDALIAAPAHP